MYKENGPMRYDGDIVIIDPCFINDNLWYKDFDKIGLTNFVAGTNGYHDGMSVVTNIEDDKIIGQVWCETATYCVLLLKDILKYNPHFMMHLNNTNKVTLIKDFHGIVQLIQETKIVFLNNQPYEILVNQLLGTGNVNFCCEPMI